jgi:uncharacterized membrane protein
MDLRLALYELCARHGLDAPAAHRLRHLAGLDDEPAELATWLPRGLAVLAAALGGLGLVMWIAANWDTLGRFGRFALLQGFVLVLCVGALARPAARTPLALLALLGIGALFAFFGQTYQTGADPWQLFALWAALALPLCLGARSDVLWAPWALVVATAIALWLHAHVGHRWGVEPDDLGVHLIGWAAALLLAAALSPVLWRISGAGPWAFRTAITLLVTLLTLSAIAGLFGSFGSRIAPHYALALAMLAFGAALLCLPVAFDVFALSAVALGLDSLLVAGLARLMFNDDGGDTIGRLLLIGVVAAGLLAVSVSAILRLERRYAAAGAAR